MFKIPKPHTPVCVLCEGVLESRYDSLPNAIRGLGFHVARNFARAAEKPDSSWQYYTRYPYNKPRILVWQDGALIRLTEFKPYEAAWTTKFPSLPRESGGPVPGAGRRRRQRRYCRPKTIAARRQAEAVVVEEGEPSVRPKRSAAKLPTNRDDWARTDLGVRSWKKHRLTQWR